MERIVKHFPNISGQIFDLLDDESLSKCRQVKKSWKDFLESQMFFWNREIKKQPEWDRLLSSKAVKKEQYFELGKSFLQLRTKLNFENDDERNATRLVNILFRSDWETEQFFDLGQVFPQFKNFLSPKGDKNIHPLFCAIHLKNEDLIIRTLKCSIVECRLLEFNQMKPLHFAIWISAKEQETQTLLFLLYRFTWSFQVYHGVTPLHFAAYYGHFNAVKLLIALMGNEVQWINPKCKKTEVTPLHLAAAKGHVSIIKYLVELIEEKEGPGGNIHPRDYKGYMPLHCAANKGHFEAFHFLFNKIGRNKNPRNFEKTLLHEAVIGGNLDIVKSMIDELDEYSSNKKDKNSYTPLHQAVKSGHLSILKLLLERMKGNKNPCPEYGDTPLTRAAHDGRLDMVKLILHHIKKEAGENQSDLDYLSPINAAACNGELEIVQYLFQFLDEEQFYQDDHDYTPLHHAAENGQPEIVKFFMDNLKGDKNPRDSNDGTTPLHNAADCQSYGEIEDHLEVMNILFEHIEGDRNPPDDKGNTPLHRAAKNGVEKICELIIDNIQGDKNPPDNDGNTPLHLAAKKGEEQVCELIIDNIQGDKNPANLEGITPLHVAVKEYHEFVVEFLLEHIEGDKNPPDNKGITPLHIASEEGWSEVISLLLEQIEGEKNPEDAQGRRPTDIAYDEETRALIESFL